MRIGIDACCWSNKRGFGRFTRELLGALVTIDRENEYLFFADQETATNNGFPKELKVVAAPTLVAPTQAASASGRRSLNDLWALSRTVLKHDLDLFFFPAVYSYFPVFNRTKVIVTVHDLIADHHPEAVFPNNKLKLFWKSKQYLAVRQAHLILTVSEYSKQQIMEYFHVPERRVKAISEGPSDVFKVLPDDERMREVLSDYQLDPRHRFILYVGGISPHKNLKTLIDAYHQLIPDEKFHDLRLVLVGDHQNDSFHSDYPSLKGYIESQGLTEKVLFTGFVADERLAYLYNAATLFVLPSLEEGFGLPIVEAMACGAPVVASDRGSLPEILGDAGLYFDPLRADTLVNVLTELLDDDGRRQELRLRGLSRAKQFTWEAAAEKTASIFTELVGR